MCSTIREHHQEDSSEEEEVATEGHPFATEEVKGYCWHSLIQSYKVGIKESRMDHHSMSSLLQGPPHLFPGLSGMTDHSLKDASGTYRLIA